MVAFFFGFIRFLITGLFDATFFTAASCEDALDAGEGAAILGFAREAGDGSVIGGGLGFNVLNKFIISGVVGVGEPFITDFGKDPVLIVNFPCIPLDAGEDSIIAGFTTDAFIAAGDLLRIGGFAIIKYPYIINVFSRVFCISF